MCSSSLFSTRCSPFFFFNDTATTEIYTLSLHDALPISRRVLERGYSPCAPGWLQRASPVRSEEHTSELQSHLNLVCRLLLEKKNGNAHNTKCRYQYLQRFSARNSLSCTNL